MRPADMKVLVTGATGGIGARLAAILAARGARLLVTARDRDKLDALCRRLETWNNAFDAVVADLTTSDGRATLVATARRFEGGINVLVNNAAVNRFGLFGEQSTADIESVMNTNIVAPMVLTRELLPILKRQDASVIANVGSIVGSIGLPGQVAYASSKFAMHGFSESLRRELSGTTTRVIYVAPRSTDTEMNDESLRRINDAIGVRSDDVGVVATKIADAIVRIPRERFIGWPERLFVKINALLPGLVDRSTNRQTELLTTATVAEPSPATIDGASQ